MSATKENMSRVAKGGERDGVSTISPRSMRRHTQRAKIVGNITSHVVYWLGKMAHEMAYTDKQIDDLHVSVFDSPGYDKLTERDRGGIDGVWNYMWKEHFHNKLFWTHVIDGKRVIGGDPSLEGRYGELDNGESYHCYLYGLTRPDQPPALVYIPLRQEDRDREIASGRLKGTDVSDIINGRRNGNKIDLLVPGSSPNGPACLTQSTYRLDPN